MMFYFLVFFKSDFCVDECIKMKCEIQKKEEFSSHTMLLCLFVVVVVVL